MRDRRTWTVLLAGLAWLSLSSGGAPPMGAAGSAGAQVVAEGPWTPEVPAIEQAFRQLDAPLSQSDLARVARTVAAEATRAGFSPAFVLAVIEIESGGDPHAVSPKGAIGLMQLLPATGKHVAGEIGLRWDGSRTLFDPVVNVRLGVAYLERLRAQYGSLSIALTAYNWGPTRVSSMIRRSEPIPVGYSRRVLDAWRERGQAGERPI